MKVLYIDDLDGLSKSEVKKAASRLRIKERLIRQMERQGRQIGLTRQEYLAAVMERAEHAVTCPMCGGAGKLHLDPPREVGCIHPSSAEACRLRLWHDVKGILAPQEFIKPELQITFKIGHVLHDFVQAALRASMRDDDGKLIRPEDYFDPEARVDMGLVRGNTDGDMEFDDTGGILEIKTDGPSSYPSRRGPEAKHRTQAGGLYATGLARPFTVYLYMEKVWPHSMKEYVEVYDPRVFRRWWKAKGIHVQRALDEDQVPLADAREAECRQCPYGYEGGCDQNISKRKKRSFVHHRSRRRK